MTGPRTTGVWISANSATVLRWSPELTVRHRIDSTVPGRHRSTGRPPTEEHPGGAGHRDEHMRTFLDQVAHAVPVDDDLLLVGDGRALRGPHPHRRHQPRPRATDPGREERSDHRTPVARPDPHLRRFACQTLPAALTAGCSRDPTRRAARPWGRPSATRAGRDPAARERRSEGSGPPDQGAIHPGRPRSSEAGVPHPRGRWDRTKRAIIDGTTSTAPASRLASRATRVASTAEACPMVRDPTSRFGYWATARAPQWLPLGAPATTVTPAHARTVGATRAASRHACYQGTVSR
jgi:hypothetical protein